MNLLVFPTVLPALVLEKNFILVIFKGVRGVLEVGMYTRDTYRRSYYSVILSSQKDAFSLRVSWIAVSRSDRNRITDKMGLNPMAIRTETFRG